MASKVERDARLDQLAAYTKKWAKVVRGEIEERIKYSKAILKGRTGAERLAQSGVKAAVLLTVDEIDAFLKTK